MPVREYSQRGLNVGSERDFRGPDKGGNESTCMRE